MTTAAAPDLLATIVAGTRHSVAVRAREAPREALDITWRAPAGREFERALRESAEPRIVAECKRRSPSRGILRQDYDAAVHARAYEAAGAAAISVLTEPTFFDGAAEHLRAVRAAVRIPVLRKDFIVTEYQVYEAAALGADAVLLIASAVSDAELSGLSAIAQDLGLACVVEVHGLHEVERARAAGARIVGVNSRNLRTLQVDPGVLERLAPLLPPHVTAVAESGIRSGEDIRRLSECGYHAFLVGEGLITQQDPGLALRDLRAAGRAAMPDAYKSE